MSRSMMHDIGDGCPYQLTEWCPGLSDITFAVNQLYQYHTPLVIRQDHRGVAVFVAVPSQYTNAHGDDAHEQHAEVREK